MSFKNVFEGALEQLTRWVKALCTNVDYVAQRETRAMNVVSLVCA